MQTSELFLMAWATIATVLAIVFKHIATRAHRTLLLFQVGLMLVADGKAEIYKNGDKVGIKQCEPT
jgi:hypothetical protein